MARAEQFHGRDARLGRFNFFERVYLKMAATRLVDEIDYRAFVAIEESDELAEIR